MVIKSCLKCEFHQIKQEMDSLTSYCRRENCWSRFSRCVISISLIRFLKEETSEMDDLSSDPLSGMHKY